jgi:SulP family sulfate permease
VNPRRPLFTLRHWKADLVAGVTVGVVALPLALAFGVTSGAGASAGLYTAIIAGLLAAIFGGSNYQVSGPTGAMTVVLLPIVARYGLEGIFVAGILAGLILVLLGLLRVGRYIAFIPWPVVTGFTNGIAIVIFLQQLPAALGVARPHGEFIVSASVAAVRDWMAAPDLVTPAVALATAALLVAWPRVSDRLPGAIVALAAGTVVVALLDLPVARIGSVAAGLPLPRLPQLGFEEIIALLQPALAIAALAGIESLLSAVVADGMTVGERHDSNRELVGQGIANLIAPLFGGVPATGAIARTAVNIRSGGRTRLSPIVHASFLLAVLLALGPVTALVPLACLAGILMATAARMVEYESGRAILRAPRSDAFVMLLTTGITVGLDLIAAIEVGLIAAAFLFIRRMTEFFTYTQIALDSAPSEEPAGNGSLLRDRIVAYRLDGPLFFGAAERFIELLTSLSTVEVVILRMRRVKVIDATGAHALQKTVQRLASHGVLVLLSGVQEQPLTVLTRMGIVQAIGGPSRLFLDTGTAITHARQHLAERPRHRPERATAY